MAADYSRVHRLLKVLTLIQGNAGGMTARAIAQDCRTTERTIYRDLRCLEEASVPISFDKDTRGYRVRNDFFLPPVQLTLDESLALTALGEHVAGKEQVPFLTAAERAITKLRTLLPANLRNDLESLQRHVQIRLAAASPPESGADVYQKVRRALLERKALHCAYESASGSGKSAMSFEFQPFALMFNQRAWYVVGHHGAHNEVRCLRLTRFTRVEPTRAAYTIPRGFSLEKHLGNAWRMIRGKPSYVVEIQFDPSFADTIADTLWHRTQKVEWTDDGGINLSCTVDGLDEIVWWILSMGPHCRVVRPPELRARVAELARKTAELYRAEK